MIQHRNLNGLRMFHHTARLLNFRHAADALSITQGAVAQQVRSLEADLGVQLFYRHARGLSLTPQGEALANEIAPALQKIDAALSAVKTVSNTLSLSVTPSFAAKWLGPRLPLFQHKHPDIDLEITADQRVSDFASDRIDLAVRQGLAPTNPAVDWLFLGGHALVAVGAKALLETYPPDTPLGNYPLIEDGHRPWSNLIETGSIARSTRMLRVNQTSLALDAAERGQGVALVPACYLDPKSDTLVQLDHQIPQIEGSGFYLVWPKGRVFTPAFLAVQDWIVEGFKPR